MPSQRIVVLFNLKAGRSAEHYETWARQTDLPTVNALDSVDRFEVFKAAGVLGSDASPPVQYIEIIDVADMERFGQECASATMRRVAAEFQNWADAQFLLMSPVG
jgi:hypothetical protein